MGMFSGRPTVLLDSGRRRGWVYSWLYCFTNDRSDVFPDRGIITTSPFYSDATSPFFPSQPAIPDHTTPGPTLVHLSSHFDYMLRGARRVQEKEPYGWRWGIEATAWIIRLCRRLSDSCTLTLPNRLNCMTFFAHSSHFFPANLARLETHSWGALCHIADWLITSDRTWTATSVNSYFYGPQTHNWALPRMSLKRLVPHLRLLVRNTHSARVGIMWQIRMGALSQAKGHLKGIRTRARKECKLWITYDVVATAKPILNTLMLKPSLPRLVYSRAL